MIKNKFLFGFMLGGLVASEILGWVMSDYLTKRTKEDERIINELDNLLDMAKTCTTEKESD